MNRTKIEYLDWTWNPIVDCNGVSCAVSGRCWAKGQAKRRKNDCVDCYAFKPHYHLERLKQPLAVKKPSRIGVCFMGDLFEGSGSYLSILSVFEIMQEASSVLSVLAFPSGFSVSGLLRVPMRWVGMTETRADGLGMSRKKRRSQSDKAAKCW